MRIEDAGEVIVRRQYVYVGGNRYGDVWEAPGQVDRVVWRAAEHAPPSIGWDIEASPDTVPEGYIRGMLTCEVDGQQVAIEEVEDLVGVERDEILQQIEEAR